MKIDRSNYEIYIIDYLDGNLPPEDRQQVERFLAANPDIGEEYENIRHKESITKDRAQIEKSFLFRSLSDIPEITESNFEEFCVAYHERDLDKSAIIRFNAFLISNPEKKSLFELHKQLRFVADDELKYPHKSELKKHLISPIRRILYIASMSAAAIIIALLFIIPKRENLAAPELADKHPVQNYSKQTESVNIAEKKQQTPATKTKESPGILENNTALQIAVIDSSNSDPNDQVILAAIDSNPAPFDIIILAYISPILPSLERNVKEQNPIQATSTHDNLPEPIQDIIIAKAETSEKKKLFRPRDIIIMGAVQVGVKGFNRLTENKMSVDTDRNIEGKLTQIAVVAENFEFTKKIKKNIQN